MNFDKKRWQFAKKTSFKKVVVCSPYENFLLNAYLDDLAKVCGSPECIAFLKRKSRESTYYFSSRDAALGFFCRVNCIKGVCSRMF